jgi:hypothetical protein
MESINATNAQGPAKRDYGENHAEEGAALNG